MRPKFRFRRKKKNIVYHVGENKPITRDYLNGYHELSMFFVSSDGFILPITPYTDHNVLSRITNGKYMYKEDLEYLVFGDSEV